VPFAQGACLGIPAITAHRCVHVAGPVAGRTVLVQGGAGAVGVCAVQLARRAGAIVIATVRSSPDEAVALQAGAHHVLRPDTNLTDRVRALAPDGVHHIVEVAFGANIATDLELLAVRGSVATYATDAGSPAIPFWPLLFKNIRVDFLGSDDFTPADKAEAARAVNEALVAGWVGMPIAARFPLEEIATAHEALAVTLKYDRIHKVFAQGNFLLTVSEGTLGGRHTSFYDLFRVQNGKTRSTGCSKGTVEEPEREVWVLTRATGCSPASSSITPADGSSPRRFQR
jgi:D-arabinose 1-dehydrogenase-like Zn-dependent alcohol dehydrogenase